MSDPYCVPGPNVELPGEAAELRDELLSMSPERLVPVNAHVMHAAFRVLGALPRLEKHRPALLELFGEPGVRSLNRLARVARAACRADALALVTVEPDLNEIAAELRSLRGMFLAEAAVLEQLGRLGQRRPLPPCHARGYKQLALEVLSLTVLLFDPALAPHLRIDRSLQSRAEALVHELNKGLGRACGRPPPSPIEDLRIRAFSLLVETYDDVRRQMTYLRWKAKDVDVIMPSLWEVGPEAQHNAQRRRARKARRENGA